MTTHRKSIYFLAIPLAVLATFVLPGSPALADNPAQVTANGQSWRIQYMNGPITVTRGKKHRVEPLRPRTKLDMKVGANEIVFAMKHGPVLSIPASAITEVTYDHATHRVSRAVVAQIGDINGCSGAGSYGCAGFVMGDLFVAAATLPFKYTNHYVRIKWLEQDEEKTIEFRVGKEIYQPLLSQLQSVSGVNWRDMTQEMKSTHQALVGTNPCEHPALAAGTLSIPFSKLDAMQNDLNSAGACGFRFSGIGASPSASLAANMHKESPDGTPYQYILVHAVRPSKIQQGLNQAGAQGYRLRAEGLTLNILPPFMAMEKPSASAHENYQYLYISSWRESKLRNKREGAIQQGYQVVAEGNNVAGYMLILERPTRPAT